MSNILDEMEDLAMDEGFFGGLFDLNGDGELDAGEMAIDFMAFEEMMKDIEDEEEYEDEY